MTVQFERDIVVGKLSNLRTALDRLDGVRDRELEPWMRDDLFPRCTPLRFCRFRTGARYDEFPG
jgi:hypothetical protein